MRYQGRNAVVLGLGQTGMSLVRHLVRHGALVRVADTRAAPPHAAALAGRYSGVPLTTGPITEETLRGADLIAISPGIAKDQAAIADAVAQGAELVGDVELFARALPADQKVLAITGTNGKTTVTALTGALTHAAGLSTIVAGNIGDAVLDVLEPLEMGAPFPRVFVLELSSYQLETTASLKPVAAAVLNVSANHLDRYAGIADYASAKARIFTQASVQILNRDDPIVRLMRLPGRTAQTFGAGVPQSEEEWGLVERDGGPWLARGGELIMPASALSLVGRHNAQNALAALALASSVAKVSRPMLDALARFEPLPHRMERVADVHGVRFINDSKGTTVAATQVALDGLAQPVVLIAGGDGKGQSFRPLRSAVDRACRAVLLIGRDAPLVARGLADAHPPVEMVGTLDRAVERAFELAQPGDAVLLSPACASLDQFRDYTERGERFRALVRARASEAAHA
ncbi:MAG TPA: UDP-N-acetylmuramoyl-L-alanine--D-glutamate ligase [Casimicrobiaceae bacterium]|nr:UDP-N-acetylmuramoyl-L-alanine--D-glutamate ligase [Casimicrobiaceae bacterium]